MRTGLVKRNKTLEGLEEGTEAALGAVRFLVAGPEALGVDQLGLQADGAVAGRDQVVLGICAREAAHAGPEALLLDRLLDQSLGSLGHDKVVSPFGAQPFFAGVLHTGLAHVRGELRRLFLGRFGRGDRRDRQRRERTYRSGRLHDRVGRRRDDSERDDAREGRRTGHRRRCRRGLETVRLDRVSAHGYHGAERLRENSLSGDDHASRLVVLSCEGVVPGILLLADDARTLDGDRRGSHEDLFAVRLLTLAHARIFGWHVQRRVGRAFASDDATGDQGDHGQRDQKWDQLFHGTPPCEGKITLISNCVEQLGICQPSTIRALGQVLA